MNTIDMTNYVERARIENDFIITGYNSNQKKLNKLVKADQDFGYVLGSYLSVGTANIITYKKSKRGIVFWYVEKDSYDDPIEKLKSSLQSAFNLTISIREQKKSSTLQIVSYSKPLATLLSELGTKSGRKMLPQKFLYNDKDYLKGLISGIEDFDGHKPDSRDVLKKRKISMSVIELYNTIKMY